MNKRISIWSLSALLFVGLVTALLAKSNHPAPDNNQPRPDQSINDTVQAHNGWQHRIDLSVTVEAVKLTSMYIDPKSGLPNFFERKVTISTNGAAFRFDLIDPWGVIQESEIFDGRKLHRTEIRQGRRAAIEDRTGASHYQTGASHYQTVEFGILNLGLIAVLNHISDPAAEINFLGLTLRKQDKVEVKVAAGSFIMYADRDHIIRRVEVGKYTIEYADFRPVEGVMLPLIQRVFVGGQLKYELIFTRIELDQPFPPGYFSRAALS